MPTPAISVNGLRKTYGDREAVAGIDLEVTPGEVFAFLGPNGAGKTTTTEILEGYRERTGGDVRVLGTDPQKAGSDWRARIGVVLQDSAPSPYATVRESLDLYATYYPTPRDVAQTMALVGLTEQSDQRVGKLSGGQKRRLDVGLALIGDPELIFLDEPTTGFDPAARRTAWETIEGLRELGKTIFLTTHFMDEAERLADRIVVIAAGRIVASGTPATLGGRDTEGSLISFSLPPGVAVGDVPLPGAHEARPGHVEIAGVEPVPALSTLTEWAAAKDFDLHDLEVRRPTLEDVYLRLVT